MNVSARQTAKPSRSVTAEASAWLAQLHGPQRSADLEADFRSWLEADPEHARAFERVTDVWEAIGSVNVGGLPRLAARDPFVPSRARLQFGLAALICAIVAVGAYLVLRSPSYSTEIGEQRTVTLEDGTRVSLNSATRIDVEFRRAERAVILERGEALFEVARNPERPFTVTAGDRKVTALGTSFVVRREPDRIAVTLLEGKVSIALVAANASPEVPAHMLAPGERLTVRADRTEKIDAPQTEAVTAWRRGEVILDDTPLSQAVVEMNRYDRTRLVLDHPQLAELPVSGIYRAGNNQDFARAVATMYDLDVVTEKSAIRLRKNSVQPVD